MSDWLGFVDDSIAHFTGRALAGPLRSLVHRAGSVAGLLGECRMLAVGRTLPCVVVTFWEQHGKSLACYSKQFVFSF